MAGGNRYEAVVTSVGQGEVVVLIREVYRHPSLAGTPSFPTRVMEPTPYPAEPLFPYSEEGEEEEGEEERPFLWEEEPAEEEAPEEEGLEGLEEEEE